MSCLSPARKNELRPPTSSGPVAGVCPSGWQTLLGGSYLHTAELGRVETAAIWLLPSLEVGLHGHCAYTVPTQAGLEVLITSPKTKTKQNKKHPPPKPHSVRGSQLWLTVWAWNVPLQHPCPPVTYSDEKLPAVLRYNCPGEPARWWWDASSANYLKNPAGPSKWS